MPNPTENSDGSIHAGNIQKWFQAQTKKNVGVDTHSLEYDALKPKWDRMQTLLDGTDAMRAAGERYLPLHAYESRDAYRERLAVSVLDNWTLRTLETLVGKAFRDPPQVDKMAPQIAAISKDMDGCGTSWLALAQKWFREGIAKKEAWLLVDYSATQARVDGQPRNLEDDRLDGVRPYWRIISPEDVIFKLGITVNGCYTLTHVRIMENSMEEDGEFGEKLVERIRVLRPGEWSLYRKIKDTKSKKIVWVKEDAGTFGIQDIPMRLFCTDPDKPPLDDLTHLNVAHFQSSSDQRSILTVSRFAMLAASGVTPADSAAGETPLVVGPNKWLSMPDAAGKFYYVEHSGAAIGAGRNDLQDLEHRMSSFGAEFLKRQAGRASATGRALDSSEAQSLLQTWVRLFGEALQGGIDLTGEWLKLPENTAGTVKFEMDSELDAGDPTELEALTSARQTGDLSRISYLTEFMRRGILPDDFDPEADKVLLEAELAKGSALGGMFKNEGITVTPPPPAPAAKPTAPADKKPTPDPKA